MPRIQIKDEKATRSCVKGARARRSQRGSLTCRPAVSRRQVDQKRGKSPSYEDWSKADLVRRAREIGIKGRSSMSKSQLVRALRNH